MLVFWGRNLGGADSQWNWVSPAQEAGLGVSSSGTPLGGAGLLAEDSALIGRRGENPVL